MGEDADSLTGTYRLSYYLSRRQSRTDDKGAYAPVLVVALDGKPFHRNCVFVNDFYNYNEMNRYETLTPTLVAPANGFYRLVIPAAGPRLQPCVTNGVANNLTYYPACANVFFDGEKQAQLRLQTDAFEPFELRLPYLEAGEHSFSFEVGADIPRSAFRFKEVSLEPLSQMVFTRDARKDTVIDLEANTVLELRYDGVFKIGRLIRRGERLAGTFSAATHPEWVKGPGVLEVVPKGIVIDFR